MRITAGLVLFLTVRSLSAQQLDQFEKILFPVSPNVTLLGANRIFYSTSTIYSSNRAIQYYPAYGLPNNALGIGTLMPTDGDYLRIAGPSTNNGTGRVLFVEKGATNGLELTLNLNTGDYIYGALSMVPVVPESQFRTGRTVLPGIRLTRHISCTGIGVYNGLCTTVAEDRLKVFVYDPDGTGDEKILVRLHGQLVPDTILALNQRSGSDPSYPYYGQIEYRGNYGPYPLITEIVSVELVPMQDHARYWAFAMVIPPYGDAFIITPRP